MKKKKKSQNYNVKYFTWTCSNFDTWYHFNITRPHYTDHIRSTLAVISRTLSFTREHVLAGVHQVLGFFVCTCEQASRCASQYVIRQKINMQRYVLAYLSACLSIKVTAWALQDMYVGWSKLLFAHAYIRRHVIECVGKNISYRLKLIELFN